MDQESLIKALEHTMGELEGLFKTALTIAVLVYWPGLKRT